MKKEKVKWLLTLCMVCACAVMLVVIADLIDLVGAPKIGEFVPPEFDASALAGEPDGAPPSYAVMNSSDVNFAFGLCGEVSVSGDVMEVYFCNPSTNTAWLRLRATDSDGNVIGESGIIKPGEYIRDLSCTADVAAGDAVTLKIMAYESETYYSEGSVTVNVTVLK